MKPEKVLENTDVDFLQMGLPGARISLTDLVQVVTNAMLSTDRMDIGLLVGKRLDFSSLGILGCAAMSIDSRELVLRLFVRFFELLVPPLRLIDVNENDNYKVVFRTIRPWYEPHMRYTMDVVYSSFYYLSKRFPALKLAEGETELRFNIPMSKPDNSEGYEQIFGKSINFGAKEYSIEFPFPINNLDQDKLGELKATEHFLNFQLKQQLAFSQQEPLFLRKVKSSIAGFTTHLPSLEEVAGDLSFSPRTLRRRLKEHGLTYKEVLRREREERAVYLLLTTNLNISNIAEQLFYSNASNFHRAFSTWTGNYPAEYRKKFKNAMSFSP